MMTRMKRMTGDITLYKDIKEGFSNVKHIRDRDYHNNGGSTIHSLAFFNRIYDYMLEVGVKSARMHFDGKNWHRLEVRLHNGKSVWFYGFASGYKGQGSRGALYVLDSLGFKYENIIRVLQKGSENTIFFKR